MQLDQEPRNALLLLGLLLPADNSFLCISYVSSKSGVFHQTHRYRNQPSSFFSKLRRGLMNETGNSGHIMLSMTWKPFKS